MQNICFKKLKRPVDEQIFGIRRIKWVCMWLKRTNNQNICSGTSNRRTNMQNVRLC